MTSQSIEIKFSDKPFIQGNNTIKTNFKAGEYIYGRIYFDQPLSEYTDPNFLHRRKLTFSISEDETYSYSFSVDKPVRIVEFVNNYLDFDFFPSKELASDDYGSVGFFYSIFSSQILENLAEKSDKKIKFRVEVIGYGYNGWKDFNYSSCITIDYSAMSQTKMEEFLNYGREACLAGENNYAKHTAILNADYAKKLPLPQVFSLSNGKPYKTYSNENIIAFIKTRFQVTEVHNLCYWPHDGNEDFTLYKEHGLIHSMWGNITFYFIFKDPIDGFYKATGGLLVKPYLGDGKYDEPYIRPVSPILDADTVKYPADFKRLELGYESVIFVDGEKISK